MNTTYETTVPAARSGADATAGYGGTGATRILVWDWPTRLGHWLMAGSFAVAWLTSESEAWRNVHVGAGYAFGALILFRLVWGLVGTRYARFGEFVKSPRAAFAYLRSLVAGRPQHTVGHNPAGAWAIVLLLVLGAATVASGWAAFEELGGDWLEEFHEVLASFMLGVVVVHVLGVLVGSVAHRENLVRAMLNGYKRGAAAAAIPSARWWAGVLLLVWVALATALMF